MTTQVRVHPEGFWIKTHFYMEGPLLHAVTYSCIAGNPEIFRASIDTRPLMARVIKLHNRMHENKISGEDVQSALYGHEAQIGGFLDSIAAPFKSAASAAAGAVKKLGKTKLVQAIGSGVKSVVRSKVTGGLIAATAVAFPLVGVPAAAAYATANKALDVIEKPGKLVEMGKQAIDKNLPPQARAAAKAAFATASGAILKEASSNKRQLPAAAKGKGIYARAMLIAKQRAAQAKKVMGRVAAKAKAGDVEAKKYARVITLAHNARRKMQAIARSSSSNPPRLAMKATPPLNGFPALLVTQKGHIVPGRYLERAGAPKGVVLRGGKVFRGNFAVAGVDDLLSEKLDSSLFDDMSDDELSFDMSGDSDTREIFGCSNPFSRPPHLR